MSSAQQTIEQLKEKFNIVGIVNLSDPNVFRRLQSVHRNEYNHNDRIIVVQDVVDVYDYADMPGRDIRRLQEFLNQIDISNYFVIVLSGNKNINKELEQVSQLYSQDTVIISSLGIDIDLEPVSVPEQDTFCPLPWMHLYVGPDGNVLPCCVADHRYPMGNIEQQTPVEIANSAAFNQLRSNMLNGRRSKECANCYQKEDTGLPSSRQQQLKRWTVDTAKSFEPVYLDIRLNNICNLKCRMCSGYFSSAIAQEEKELYGVTKEISNVLRNRQRQLALNEIVGFLPSAEKIYFAGGEPLLAPEHYEILQRLIDCKNTDLELFYNTNFTRLQFRDINVTDLWKHFSNVTIGASLDATGAVAEYVRHGTVWADVLSNIQHLHNTCPHVNFTVNSTVGFLNVENLIEFQQSGQIDISKFSLSVMTEPKHLTLAVLPQHHKNRIRDQILNHINWCQDNGADLLVSQWTDVLNFMMATDFSYCLPEFQRLTKTMDSYRNESFTKVFPVYQDLL